MPHLKTSLHPWARVPAIEGGRFPNTAACDLPGGAAGASRRAHLRIESLTLRFTCRLRLLVLLQRGRKSPPQKAPSCLLALGFLNARLWRKNNYVPRLGQLTRFVI